VNIRIIKVNTCNVESEVLTVKTNAVCSINTQVYLVDRKLELLIQMAK